LWQPVAVLMKDGEKRGDREQAKEEEKEKVPR
jgi:hypothetical protein